MNDIARFIRRLNGKQDGQLVILSLILMALGSLIILPLLDLMRTTLKTDLIYEGRKDELYAADAGVQLAIQKMIKGLPPVAGMVDGDSVVLSPFIVNGKTVNVSLSRLSLVSGLLGDDDYKLGQPHEGWMTFYPDQTIIRNPTEDWVEVTSRVAFHFEGSGNKVITNIGAFFAPYPGSMDKIVGPYSENMTGVVTPSGLDSRRVTTGSGGFAFIWDWGNDGPPFDATHRDGALQFTFKVLDATWDIASYFAFATTRSQDISYISNFEVSKWQITSVAGATTVKAEVLAQGVTAAITAWQVNPLP